MSCNGCRVLRKGCSESCVLRPCLQLIDTAEAQGHATVFVAKFFGRAGLLSFINAVPPFQRPALFQSLLYEACGRTINPVTGAVGLLWTGNWHLCQAAVETVLRGGQVRPLPELATEDPGSLEAGASEIGALYARSKTGATPSFSTGNRRKLPGTAPDGVAACDLDLCLTPRSPDGGREEKRRRRAATPSMTSEGSVTTSGECGAADPYAVVLGEPRLLNLFESPPAGAGCVRGSF